MAQDITLRLGLNLGNSNKQIKSFRGSLTKIVKEMNKFRSTKLAKQFKDIDFVIDKTTEKLMKFEKVLNGKTMTLGFQNIGRSSGSGRLRDSKGKFASSAAREPSVNVRENNINKLNQSATMLNTVVRRMKDNMMLLNKEFRKLIRSFSVGGAGSIGGGGGRRAGSGRGGSSRDEDADFKRFNAQFAGAVGFSAIDFGTQITQLFSNRRVQGSFQNAFSNLFGQIGSIFGASISNIATDVGKAFGAFAEIGLNTLTKSFRRTGIILGALAKSLGFTIVSGIFGSFFTSGISSKLLGFGTLIVTSVINIISGLFTEFVNDFISVVQNVGTIGVSILSAAIKGLAGIFKGVAESIRNIWTALWKFVTDITKASIDLITAGIETSISVIKKFSKEGARSFIDLELGAKKVAKELFSTLNGQDLTDQIKNIAQRASAVFGTSTGDILGGLFDFVSSQVGKDLISSRGVKAISEFTKGVSVAAASDLAEFKDIGAASLTLLQNFPDAFKDAGDAAKLIASGTTNARAEVNDFANALGNVIPDAAALGLTLDETIASFSILTQKLGAGKAKNATTILARLFEAIADPKSSTANRLLDIGFDVRGIFDAAASGEKLASVLREVVEFASNVDRDVLNIIFPTRQSRRSFRSIAPELNDFEKVIADIRKGVGSVNQQAKSLLDTSGKTLDRLSASFKVLKTTAGEVILGVFKKGVGDSGILKTFTELAVIFSSKSFSGRLPEFIDKLTFAFQPLFDAVNSALVKVKEFFIAIRNGKLDDNSEFNEILSTIRSINESIADFVTNFIDALDPVKAMLDLFMVINGVIEKIQAISSELFSGNISGAVEIATGKTPGDLFAEIRTLISNLAEFLLLSLSNAINRVTLFVLDVNVPDLELSGPAKALKAVVDSLFDLLISLIVRGASTFATTVDAILKSLLQSDNPIIRAVVDSLVGKTRNALRVGTFFNDIRKSLESRNAQTTGFRGVINTGLEAATELGGALIPGSAQQDRFLKRRELVTRFGTRQGIAGESSGLLSSLLTSTPGLESGLRREINQDRMIQSTDAIKDTLNDKLDGVIEAIKQIPNPAPELAPAGVSGASIPFTEGASGIFTNGSVYDTE